MTSDQEAVPPDWLDSDVEASSWKRELQHLKRRAQARKRLVIVLAAIGSLAIAGYASRRHPLHVAKVIIRVSEGDVLRERSPLASRNLRGYIMDSTLSTRNLLALIERFDLYPLARARGERAAVGKLRDFLDVDVFRNYFLGAAIGRTTERTARIAITFRDPDPVRSFEVARALADLIVETEATRRQAYSADDLGVAQQAVDQAATSMALRQEELTQIKVELERATRTRNAAARATFTVALETLEGQIAAQSITLARAREGLDVLRLSLAMNRSQLGLRYAIVDERRPPPVGDRVPMLATIALVAFLILLPVCGVAVGAFDSKLRDREDLERLGLVVVGQVPRFAGLHVGGFEERRRRVRHTRGDIKLRRKL